MKSVISCPVVFQALLPIELPPRAAKYHQLMRLLQQREALTARLAAMQRGETFHPQASDTVGSLAKDTNTTAPVSRKTAKARVAKRRLRTDEQSSGPDSASEGSSDVAVEFVVPVVTSRGRIVKQRRAVSDPVFSDFFDCGDVYVDDGLGLTAEEQVLLAMQLSMEDATAPAVP